MAKSLTFRIIALVALLAASFSCRELSQIGDLAGQWRVVDMTTADGAGAGIDFADTYFCFYRDVAQLRAPGVGQITGNLYYDNPDLSIQIPGEYQDAYAAFGITPADVTPSKTPAGNPAVTVKFHVDKLTTSTLLLSDGSTTITLHKY